MINKIPRKFLLPAVVILVLGLGLVGYQTFTKSSKEDSGQKKSPHFLDSTPLHGEVYATQPVNITVNFDFDLAENSKLSVSGSGQEWAQGEVGIENNKTALKKELKQGMPDGEYTVNYSACWPDNSCHDGRFSFSIDSSLKSEYLDMTGKSEVKIDMKDVVFQNTKVLVSPGTKVVWVNLDDVEHFVNTETHPAHTYFTSQNSRSISKDQTYETVFTVPGQYNYHCSAHAAAMKASLIVTN